MAIARFADYQVKIEKAIGERLQLENLVDPKGFSIVDGFITLPIQKQIGSGVIIGGPVLPVVAVVSNTSGRVYYFAVKSLLPNVELA